MFWANFLHLYQPPSQSESLLRKITEECYIPLIYGIDKSKHAKLTININGSLTELLAKNGYISLLKKIAKLLKTGKIELTESAKYHPILPLLPEKEIIRQIELNYKINRYYFGECYKPSGFYPPEMAYSEKLGVILARLGFKWVIADEILTGNLAGFSSDKLFKQAGLDLVLLLRNRRISNFIASARAKTGKLLVSGIRRRSKNFSFVITAMDGETFGHHNKGYYKILLEAYRTKKLTPITLSELTELINERKEITPPSASWSSSEAEIRRRDGFALWKSRRNAIHNLQWKLTNLAIAAVDSASKNDNGYNLARHFLDVGLHSDQYWWASGRIIFGNYLLWSIEMIERGAKYLLDAVNCLDSVKMRDKETAHKLYDKILSTAFKWQRNGIVAQKRVMLSKRFARSK